ncbi:hypothetical protein [Lentzea sp. CA-135723]|uniref:hypothetical protein n=1 Tax=Lentzea sp. CA-135723 TaxID=3239950 RepID=UPI003D8E3CFD
MSETTRSRWDWVLLVLGVVFLLIGVVAVTDAVSSGGIARVLSGSVCVVLGVGTIWRWARHRAASRGTGERP